MIEQEVHIRALAHVPVLDVAVQLLRGGLVSEPQRHRRVKVAVALDLVTREGDQAAREVRVLGCARTRPGTLAMTTPSPSTSRRAHPRAPCVPPHAGRQTLRIRSQGLAYRVNVIRAAEMKVLHALLSVSLFSATTTVQAFVRPTPHAAPHGQRYHGACTPSKPPPSSRFAELPRSFRNSRACSRKLSPSGIDGLEPVAQQLAFWGYFAALGAGTAAMASSFDKVDAAMPNSFAARWQGFWRLLHPLLGALYIAAGVGHFTNQEAL